MIAEKWTPVFGNDHAKQKMACMMTQLNWCGL